MKTKVLFSLCILLPFLAISHVLHTFYVSITQIDYNAKTQSLEISTKFFTDDLQTALEKQGSGKLYLSTPQEKKEANTLIEKYLHQHLILQVNGQVRPWKWIGKEKEADATWCYLEIEGVNAPIKTIEITHSSLMECFDSQTNMVNFKISQQKKSLVLRKGEAKKTLSF
ncbi:MAG: DUF6702 family protein [Bacteroidia bacterium]